jgi:hypothetical protein
VLRRQKKVARIANKKPSGFWSKTRKISQKNIHDAICLSIYLLFILRPSPLPPPASLAFSHLSIKISWLLLIFERRKGGLLLILYLSAASLKKTGGWKIREKTKKSGKC